MSETAPIRDRETAPHGLIPAAVGVRAGEALTTGTGGAIGGLVR